MPIQIASLFAKIGADTSGLHKGLSDADKALGRTKQNTMDMRVSLGALATSFGLVAGAAKALYEVGKQGAQLERTANSFDMISGSSDAATQNLEMLRKATRNAVDDMTLMGGATNIMALGLADTADQVGSIMRNVEGLGARFGGNMQIFQLMMSNQSLMRIDSFGIGVEEATQRIDEFKKAGMNAEEAFKTAVLELMTEKYENLGGAVEDNALAYEQLEATVTNLTNDLKEQASAAISPIIKRYVEFLSVTKENDQSLIGIAATIRLVTFQLTENERFAASLGVAWKLFTLQLGSAFKEIQNLPPGIHDVAVKQEHMGSTTDKLTGKTEDLNGELERELDNLMRLRGGTTGLDSYISKATTTTDGYAEALNQMSKEMANAVDAQDKLLKKENAKRLEEMADNIVQVGQAWAGVQLAMTGPIKNENEQYNDSLTRSKDRMAELQIEIDKLERGHGALIQTKQKEVMTENEMALVVAKRSDAEYRLMVELAKDDKDENATVMAQMRVNIDKYNEALNVTVDTTKKYVDNTKRISELRAEYDEVALGIKELGDAHDEATKRILFNMLSQRVAMSEGGDTDEAQTAFMELANKMGLVDDATLDWWNSIDKTIDRVDDQTLTWDAAFDLFYTSIVKAGLESDKVMPAMLEQVKLNTREWLLYWEAVGGVAASLENMPTEVHTTLYVHNKSDGPMTPMQQIIAANPDDFPNGAPTVPEAPGGGKSGMETVNWNGSINVNGAGDPQSTANAVIQKLADRGIIHAGGYR